MVKLLQRDSVAYTIPDKPKSRLQKYGLTDKGRAQVESLNKKWKSE